MMFQTIFLNEIRHWLRQPYVYIFAFLLFLVSWATMWGMASEAPGGPDAEMMNSYYRINFMSNYLSMLMLFLLPGTIGASVYRDYKSQMYTLLYAYPITKPAYLCAKFLAAYLVVCASVAMIGLGFFLGTQMPGVKPDVLLPSDLGAYLQLYGVYILPNMLLLGLVVFAVVLRTRNIYIAFISIILLMLAQGGIGAVLSSEKLAPLAALLDPLGDTAVKQTVRYWTKAARNTEVLPLSGIILYNRVLWLTVSILLGLSIYRRFNFQQFVQGTTPKNTDDKLPELSSEQATSINVPGVSYDFSLHQRLLTAWHTAVADMRYVVISWPFIAILVAGVLLVYFQQHQMNPIHGFEILPTTGRMLRVPMFIFGLVINLISFLYFGLLHFRGQTTRMGDLTDTLPQPNWLLLLSRLGTVLLVQLLLLSLVMVSGILAQTIQGYYRYELWHYAFELFVLQFPHFIIWTLAAVLVYTLVRNLYLGFFILLLLPTAVSGLRPVSDFLNWPFLRQSVLQFNQVPGITVGFDYSDLLGYGNILPLYLAFKSYWLILGIVFLLLSLLFWSRGLTFTWGERWRMARKRFQGPLRFGIIAGTIVFLLMGSYLYVEENYEATAHFTAAEQEMILVLNEQRYAQFENYPQPRLAKAEIFMDIFPKSRDFFSRGELGFVNKLDRPIDTILVGTSFRESTGYQLFNPAELISRDDTVHLDLWKLEAPLSLGDTLWLRFEIENQANSLLHDNSRVQSNGTYINANILPRLGFRSTFLSGEEKRKKYGLPERASQQRLPTDSLLLGYAFAENNMDRIVYETTVGTSASQKAFSMGTLVDQWQEGDRNYATYRSDGLITNNISWLSGAFSAQHISANELELIIYNHPEHGHNFEHLTAGLQASLNYCGEWFGPLDYDTLRLIEYPLTEGTYATLNGNLIPYSEALFLCAVDDEDNDVFNMPFYTAAHEVAHYWWGHQVDPANVYGGKIVTEALAEYLAMQVMEDSFGAEKVLAFRKKTHQVYLRNRAREGAEKALILARDHQDYLTYRKGGLAFYALGQYWGEMELNTALASYADQYRHAAPPYPTGISLVDHLEAAVPDSLGYLLNDYFRTITLYDNALEEYRTEDRADGSVRTTVEFTISKYRADASGKRSYENDSGDELQEGDVHSLPLADFVQIGFYEKEDQVLPSVVRTINVRQIQNEMVFQLPFAPARVEIDPWQLLFEEEREDNG